MYGNTNQFPELTLFGPHSKPHGARGLSKHYHLRFDQEIGNGVSAVRCIPCACVTSTTMQD